MDLRSRYSPAKQQRVITSLGNKPAKKTQVGVSPGYKSNSTEPPVKTWIAGGLP